MRVLILGGAGMLGHKLAQKFCSRFDTWVTLRSARTNDDLLAAERTLMGVDASDLDSVSRAISTVRPQVVVNSIGIIKQLREAHEPVISLTVNSLFPHRLANLCRAAGTRIIHISTDCVFSGSKGSYTETDLSDATDLYGRTKYLGEVNGAGCLTLRTSIIGRELHTTSGVVEWFLSNRGGKVRGFTRALYTGFTTLALADIIANIIEQHPDLEGVYHVSSDPINKYELLCLLREAYLASIEIEADAGVAIDRSLDSDRFRRATGFAPPPWPQMVQEMASDPTPYESIRRSCVS